MTTPIWPAIVIICLYAVNFSINAIRHGETVEARYSIGWSLFRIALIAYILYCGGFFDTLRN